MFESFLSAREFEQAATDPLAKKLWSKVSGCGDDCWIFQRSVTGTGYGQLRFKGKAYSAHVLAYILTHGELPKGKMVTHKCDARACCNPDHLVAKTHAGNMEDMKSRKRNRGSKWMGYDLATGIQFTQPQDQRPYVEDRFK